MKTLDLQPNAITEHLHVWIPMSDGTRLSAHLWLPSDAGRHPVPAIFEFIPYRHSDGTAVRDSRNHRYFAAKGYASVRVDIRGSGNSEGVLTDEYLQQELDDGVEIIHWIARQPWCDGSVGMIGISWGGFNGLQIAALQPEPLKAVVSVCSTDDRYADDVHYMGGCLLGDNLSWASVMFSYNSAPPDPKLVGEAWREMWLERLENSGLWLETWLRHPHRDAYWKHGSICEDWSAVQVPVLAASGWADGYTNSVFRLLENLPGPSLGLVGPWSHKYPHQGIPGPAIGFLQTCVDWWDRWLKGIDNGIDSQPRLQLYTQDKAKPFTSYQQRPGHWTSEPDWPSPNVRERRYALAPGYALEPATDRAVDEVALPDQSPLSVGLFAGKWCSYAYAPDLPGDQREDDGGSLVFESEVLEEELEILGAPRVELELSSDQPVAMVCVRISDVAPSRTATRITYGVLNLTHRDGHEHPRDLEPGRRYRVEVKLNHMAHRFRPGHRVRVAISTSYWPLAWPAPRPACLTFYTGKSALFLPVRETQGDDSFTLRHPQPEAAPPLETEQLRPQHHSWKVYRDLEWDESSLEVINDNGTIRFPHLDLEVEHYVREVYSYRGEDFSSPRGEVVARRSYRRDDWHIITRTRTVLTCDPDSFYLRAELDAYEGDKRVFAKNWDRKIPRQDV